MKRQTPREAPHLAPQTEAAVNTKTPWTRPELSVMPIGANTHLVAHTVSDATGNLFS